MWPTLGVRYSVSSIQHIRYSDVLLYFIFAIQPLEIFDKLAIIWLKMSTSLYLSTLV